MVFSVKDRGKVEEFYYMMKQVCPQFGIVMNTPIICQVTDDSIDSYLSHIKAHASQGVREKIKGNQIFTEN